MRAVPEQRGDELGRTPGSGLGQRVQPIGHDERPGVDEGVAWSAGVALELGDGAVAGRGGVPAHLVPGVGVELEQGGQGEELGDALQRERLVAVTDGEHLPLDGGHRHRHPVARNHRELGDLAGHHALVGGLPGAAYRRLQHRLHARLGQRHRHLRPPAVGPRPSTPRPRWREGTAPPDQGPGTQVPSAAVGPAWATMEPAQPS